MTNQTTCPNCKAVLSEGAAFCPMCGAKVEAPAKKTVLCSGCGAQIDEGTAFCPVCGKPVSDGSPASLKTENPAVKKSVKSGILLKKPLLIAIPAAIIVLVLLIVAVLKIKPSGGSHLIYVKDDELQFSNLSKKSSFELTDDLIRAGYFDEDDYYFLSFYIFMSEDGRYIFYPDRIEDYDMSYYWRDLKADNAKKDASVKIDSEINFVPFLTKDGSKFFYIKGNDNRMYVYDRKSGEKVKLDDDVVSYYINDEGDYIIYSKHTDFESTIYEMSLKGTAAEKTKIDSNASILSAFPNEKKVYYSKDGSLYIKEFAKNKEKITSEYDILVSIVDNGSIYYMKREEITKKLSDFIRDDMAEADKEEIVLPEPNYSAEPEYPSASDYQTMVWVDSYWGWERHPETNEWGYWDYVTDEEAYQAALDAYYKAYEAWEKEVEQYYNDYNNAYARLQAKENRDYLRELLDNEDNAVTYNKFSLYYWNKGTETLVADDVYESVLTRSNSASIVVYKKYDVSSVDMMKMSELNDADIYYYDFIYDLQEKISTSRKLSDEVYVAINEKESTIDCSGATTWSINSKGAIFFLDDYDNEKGYGELMYVPIKNGSVEKPVKIDEDVNLYVFGNENENIYYFKDLKDYSGDLYMNDRLIATDVYALSLYNYKGKDKLLYFKDYSRSSESGSLCIFDNGKETRVFDDVSFFVAVNDNDIAFLYDYRPERSKGDLMLYTGRKQPFPVETDVTAMLWNPDMLWDATGYGFYY